MLKAIETPNAPKPFSNYSQGIAVDPGARYVFVAGQVGATPLVTFRTIRAVSTS